jgi:tRNA (guanine-N7-)-methyltransferase
MKKQRKRLTSTVFLNYYRNILKDNGIIHLKTDSNFLFTYTNNLVEKNLLPINAKIDDIYSSPTPNPLFLNIKTYYESQWLARGISIKYLEFILPQTQTLQEPEIEIDFDEYRSYGRQKRSEIFSRQ